jgi:hypothetical protein
VTAVQSRSITRSGEYKARRGKQKCLYEIHAPESKKTRTYEAKHAYQSASVLMDNSSKAYRTETKQTSKFQKRRHVMEGEPEVYPEVYPEVDPKVDPEVCPEVDPKVDPEVYPELLEVEPEVESEVIEVEPEPETEAEPESPPEAEPAEGRTDEVEEDVEKMDVEKEAVAEAEAKVEDVEMDADLGTEKNAVNNVHQEAEVEDNDEFEVEHEVLSAAKIDQDEKEEDVEVICRNSCDEARLSADEQKISNPVSNPMSVPLTVETLVKENTDLKHKIKNLGEERETLLRTIEEQDGIIKALKERLMQHDKLNAEGIRYFSAGATADQPAREDSSRFVNPRSTHERNKLNAHETTIQITNRADSSFHSSEDTTTE